MTIESFLSYEETRQLTQHSSTCVKRLELHLDSVFRFSISQYFLGILPTNTEGKLGKNFLVLCLWREYTHQKRFQLNSTAIRNITALSCHLSSCRQSPLSCRPTPCCPLPSSCPLSSCHQSPLSCHPSLSPCCPSMSSCHLSHPAAPCHQRATHCRCRAACRPAASCCRHTARRRRRATCRPAAPCRRRAARRHRRGCLLPCFPLLSAVVDCYVFVTPLLDFDGTGCRRRHT